VKYIKNYNKEELKLKAIATDLREYAIKMIYFGKDGHPGPSLTLAEIIACLYFKIINFNPDDLYDYSRDRLVLSKGHACPMLYAALMKKNILLEEEIDTLRKIDTRLQGHPDCNKTPGVEITSGSLGNGLSLGVGMALGGKIYKDSFRVFVILGDGELDEGVIWEAAMSASKYKLDNLIAFIDKNEYQSGGNTKEIMPLEPLREKWESFNWDVYEINGHSIREILQSIRQIENNNKPNIIIANTTKGYGISFMENNNRWHKCLISDSDYRKAISELEIQRARIRELVDSDG
jgi:transketolase